MLQHTGAARSLFVGLCKVLETLLISQLLVPGNFSLFLLLTCCPQH